MSLQVPVNVPGQLPPMPLTRAAVPDGVSRDPGAEGRAAGADGSGGKVAGSVHRIVRNSTWNLVVQGLYAVLNLAAIMVLARGMGQSALGEYYTLFALVITVQLVVELGLSTVLTRRIAQAPGRWREIVAEATGLVALVALLSASVFVAVGGAWAWLRGEPALVPLCALAGLTCAAMQVQRFCGGVFRAFEQFGYENVAKLLQGALFALLIVGLLGRGFVGLGSVLAMLAVSYVAAAGFLIVGLRGRARGIGWRLNLAVVKDWLAEAVPLGVGDVVRGLTWQLDTVLLSLLQPAAVVGIYSVAYRPLGPLNWLPRTVLTATFPAFARMAGADPEALNRAFASSIRLLWIISLPIAVGICICAEPAVMILAGREYLEAAAPLRLLIWITCLSFLSFQYRFLFAAVGKQRVLAQLVVVVFVVEAVIELVAIPWWGYFGACAGSLVGEVVFTVAGLAVCARHGIGKVEWSALARAALAGAVMGIVLWFGRGLPLPLLFVAAALSTGLYFVLCLWWGALRGSEVRHFYDALISPLRTATRRVAAGDNRPGAVPEPDGGCSWNGA